VGHRERQRGLAGSEVVTARHVLHGKPRDVSEVIPARKKDPGETGKAAAGGPGSL